MSTFFNEATYEEAVIELFENMGYTHIHAPNMGRTDFSDPLLDSVLRDSLVKINKGLPLDAINEAIGKLRNFDSGSLVQKNVVISQLGEFEKEPYLFDLAEGQVAKIDLFFWLEGQDTDCGNLLIQQAMIMSNIQFRAESDGGSDLVPIW